MKKISCILIALLILIITGCASMETIRHDYVFKGENESWSAELKVKGTGTFSEKDGRIKYDSSCDKVFTVTYNKDLSQLSSVKRLEISYESSAGAGKLVEDFKSAPPNEKTYVMKSGSKGGAIENKDEVIKVSINLDGKIEVIELRNVK
jgi:hypothetical protein